MVVRDLVIKAFKFRQRLLSFITHVTTVEFTKILSHYLAFTSKKINLREFKKESPNYRFDLVQARMIETLSVSFAFHVHVEHGHESVLR